MSDILKNTDLNDQKLPLWNMTSLLDIKLKRKQLHNIWYQKNQEKQREYGRLYYYQHREEMILNSKRYNKINAEKRAEYQRIWAKKNNSHVKERARKWSQTNAPLIRMYYAKRKQYIAQATPKWANLQEIMKIYELSSQMTRETGVLHHVDHIIPLTHPKVCGLHVEGNLQILTARENSKKHNKLFF